VKRWLAKGRTGQPGDPPFTRFAAQVEAARAEQELPEVDVGEVMTAEELKKAATKAARGGSVQAMRLVKDLIAEGGESGHDRPDDLDRIRARFRARKMRNGGPDPYADDEDIPPGGWAALEAEEAD
jgi:hypothetical protein